MILCINIVFGFHWSIGFEGVNHLSHTRVLPLRFCNWDASLSFSIEVEGPHWTHKVEASWEKKKVPSTYIFPTLPTIKGTVYQLLSFDVWMFTPNKKKLSKRPNRKGASISMIPPKMPRFCQNSPWLSSLQAPSCQRFPAAYKQLVYPKKTCRNIKSCCGTQLTPLKKCFLHI